MAKKIYLVYQDCPMCGARKKWGEEQTKIADTHGLEIVKAGFTSPFVRENKLCSKALSAGVHAMPFFTDGGEKFAESIEAFVPKPKAKTKKAKKVKNGTTSKTK